MNRGKLIPISPIENPLINGTCNNDLINRQLNKMIVHHLFSASDILSKFLKYIVNETLGGNANQLKEYTIAVNVLNKPTDFDPQKNGIVRIHAIRLRKALTNYYNLACSDDVVVIVIPKGRYIPIFQPSRLSVSGSVSNLKYIQTHDFTNKVTLAVLPFKTHEKKFSRLAFTESLAQRISIELNRTNHFSIISYNIPEELEQGQLKINNLPRNLNLKYVLSGDVHFQDEDIRIFVRLTETSTRYQIWSDIYSFNSTLSGYFELSDIISSRIVSSLRFIDSDINQSVPGKYQLQ